MSRARAVLDWAVGDATLRFISSPPEQLLDRALILVDAKFARGDYPELQAIDAATRANLAKQLVEKFNGR